jgi:hypothetical protein
MRDELILLPLLLNMLIAVVLYLALAIAKVRALNHGEVDLQRRALHADAWPEGVQQINNCLRNQFELPMLFYVLGILLWQLGEAGVAAQSLAWLFVLSRIGHARVHTGSNHVPTRRRFFMSGCVIVLAMLLLTLWRIFVP